MFVNSVLIILNFFKYFLRYIKNFEKIYVLYNNIYFCILFEVIFILKISVWKKWIVLEKIKCFERYLLN